MSIALDLQRVLIGIEAEVYVDDPGGPQLLRTNNEN